MKSETIVILVSEFLKETDTPNKGIFSDDAQNIAKKIEEFFEKGNNIEISFKNIEVCTSVFINFLIGPIYNKYPEKAPDKISFVDISTSISMIQLKIDNAIHWSKPEYDEFRQKISLQKPEDYDYSDL